MKNRLVPVPKNFLRELGIKNSKNGPVIDNKKLSELKKMQRTKDEKPVKNEIKPVKKVIKEKIDQKDVDKGIY